jgi:anaerobic magnesium-protoporphyrin IX monomethyl ester cyclase
MRILLVNPPHPSIGSRIPDEHLPPLGLLSIGGPLLDAGHDVQLLDAEFGPMSIESIVDHAEQVHPDAILVGHSGSTSGHPIIADLTRALRARLPEVKMVYGGVYPTYHWREILEQHPQIDVIVRGEGESVTPRLMDALERRLPLQELTGLSFRGPRGPTTTGRAPLVEDLDRHRVGWELVDLQRYRYWGNRRAVVVQFSRGCPHACSYCGQRPFWGRYRHRDPKKFVAEIARLHRTYGVEVFNLADENPTASRQAWREVLEALVAEQLPVIVIGSTRADDIVRDAELLPLYKKAGVARFLLGIESTDPATLRLIRKGSTTPKDREAIARLRAHGILSLATWVVGFKEETDRDFWQGLRQLLLYDPDQIQMVFATPHRWTRYFHQAEARPIVQLDQRRWDYKHQVLGSRHVPAWRVLLWVKLIEAVLQLRPRALLRLLAHPDSGVRAGMRWYYGIGRKVWIHEIRNGMYPVTRTHPPRLLRDFWGEFESLNDAPLLRPVRTKARPGSPGPMALGIQSVRNPG